MRSYQYHPHHAPLFDCHWQPKPLPPHPPQQKAILATSHHHTVMVTIEGPSPHVSALGYLLGRRGEALTTTTIDPPCPPRCVILGCNSGSNSTVAATTTPPSLASTTSYLARHKHINQQTTGANGWGGWKQTTAMDNDDNQCWRKWTQQQ